jgi:hypothetical protein
LREGLTGCANPLATTFIRRSRNQLNPKNGGGSGYEQTPAQLMGDVEGGHQRWKAHAV